MRAELLDELELLLGRMKDNLMDHSRINKKCLDLLRRLRLIEVYQEDQSQYDLCIEKFILADI